MTACGSRADVAAPSGPDASERLGPGAPGEPPGTWQTDAESIGSYRGVLYSLNEGPVDSCDAGAAPGPVQRCTWEFPICVQEFPPLWGCCEADPVSNLDDCAYPSPADGMCH